MTDGQGKAEKELALVTEKIRSTVARLLHEGEVPPRLVARLLARLAGELGSEASLAGGTEVEPTLALLAGALRHTGADRPVPSHTASESTEAVGRRMVV